MATAQGPGHTVQASYPPTLLPTPPHPPMSDPHLQLPTRQQHRLVTGVVNPSWQKPPFPAPLNLLLGAFL